MKCDFHFPYTDNESNSYNLSSPDKLKEISPKFKQLCSFKPKSNVSRYVQHALVNYHSFGKTEYLMDRTQEEMLHTSLENKIITN